MFPATALRWSSFHWKGLYFENPLGTAGGVDKNALHIQDWQRLGAGFVEIGTLTPRTQKPHPLKILDRSLKHSSLWNNMGFPNRGLKFVKEKLSALEAKAQDAKTQLAARGQLATPLSSPPLFINIGKNRKTANPLAVEDYKKCIRELKTFAKVFVINISSPNTKGLRELFAPSLLPGFLKSIKGCAKVDDRNIPLILKLSPDETEEDFIRIMDQSLNEGIDGWCLCNSTNESALRDIFKAQAGGVSGKLLAKKSLKLLQKAKNWLDQKGAKDKLLISCGGVLTAEDVLERLQEGADLVQVYSALVFKGPGFFHSVFKELSSKKSLLLKKGS